MRTAIRKAGVACSALVASTALAITTATGAWASSSALVVGGLDTPSMHDLVMAQLLGGALQGQQRVSVNWPAEHAPSSGGLSLGDSIAVGTTNLNAEIEAALGRLTAPGEKVTVVGLSAGSLVVTEVLRELVADADAPGADQITFVVVADSSRQKVIKEARYNNSYEYTYQPPPESQYDVAVVTGEFDGASDFPDRWWNFLAVLNSIAGAIYVHIPVFFADLSTVPETHITVDVNQNGGTTTHYLVPTEVLPLVQMFPFLKSQEASLRAKVEKGYSRYDGKANAQRALATAAPAAAEEVEETATPAAEVKVAAAVTDPVETTTEEVSAKDNDAVAEAEATKDDVDEGAEAEAAETEAAETEAADTEAADTEAAESEAADTEAADTEAADTEAADSNAGADAGDSASSDDSGPSASE